MDLLTWLRQEAHLKKMILAIVFLALFLDHMLLSVVVPILPSYLYKIGQAPTTTPGNSNDLTVNPPINQSLNNSAVILSSTSAPPHQTPALSSDPTVAQKFPESNCSYADAHLDEVNIKVGLMLASKSTMQLIINPFMGPLTDSFILLLLARSVQGVGGSCLSVAGMGMLADGYKDNKERGCAMGISFTGLALGLIGLQHMEAHMGYVIPAPVTTKGSVVQVLSPENCDVDILDDGRTIRDFIDNKMKELGSADNEEPFYVASLDSIFEKHLRWRTNLPRVKPFYAVKCNNNAAVLKMTSALDTGFDCASKVEIQLVLSLGVTPDKIIYAHTTKPLSHIKYACTHGVDTMTFDSEDELLKISLGHAKAKLVLRIAVDDSASKIRLNFKFGARPESVGKLLRRAGELGLEVIGVSFHVGSGCTRSLAFKQAIADARRVFDMGNLLGLQMRLLDIGGGFTGIEDCQVDFEEFSEVINGALEEFFPPDSGVQIIAEPGRYYVDSAFTLAANVIAKRVIADDMDEHSDGGDNSPDRIMMYYLNDGVYGSLSCLINDATYTSIKPYLTRVVESSEQRYRSVLWGPTCDSTDKVTDSCWIPELDVGDWLLIDNMGAYSVSLSTDFNGFERAHIYPVVTAKTWHILNLSDIYNIRQ